MTEDRRGRGPGSHDDLLRRFQAEFPDRAPEEFDRWLASQEAVVPDGNVDAFVAAVFGRLDEPVAGSTPAHAFAPRCREGREAPTTSTQRFRPGTAIAHHELRRFLGSGAMGQVWEARDRNLDRPVALKLLLRERIGDGAIPRFEREARGGGRLQHPNLVATWSHGADDGVYWIAQELVPDAWTLADAIEARRREDRFEAGWYPEVAGLVAAVADGLHAAHEAGVIHRDVKPRNVLIGSDGVPRVADFGSARLVDEATLSRTGRVVGTWGYMSPEMVRGEPGAVDRRTDVFSLGVVLYELLTLQRPFEGDTVQQTAEKILHEDPPAPVELRSGCPRELSTVCLRAIEKDPERRYASAADLAADLRRWLADEPVLAREPTLLERVRRWRRRNRALSTALAVGAVGTVLISGLWMRELRVAAAIEGSIAERDAAARVVEAERDAMLRLSASVELDELIERQRSLWPPHPRMRADLRAWIDDAGRLIGALPLHRETLENLRAGDAEALGRAPAEEVQAAWWEARLSELVQGLEALRDGLAAPDAIVPGEGWSVPKRAAFADRLAIDFGPGGAHRRAWEEALPRLAESYPGIDPAIHIGLVPLGPDPRSGLWEFAHLASGEPPVRGEDGTLELTESSGAVLVWVPGGRSWMGMQRDDPEGPNHHAEAPQFEVSRPLREVHLSPFAIGKHELTQEQWLRLSGQDPSESSESGGRRTPLLPVNYVSWTEAVRVLERFDLTLPTDAQWEHACRAGSGSPFAFGSLEEASGKFNCADLSARDAGAPFGEQKAADVFDDGYGFAAPAGSLPPNGFGLHEMHGNLWELVLDGAAYGPYGEHESSVDPFTPVEAAAPNPDSRVIRGGDFTTPWIACCSYVRLGYTSEGRGTSLGVRVADTIEVASGGASR